ncbi:MAG: uroporphyrinogen-III synthase [Sarcina sp.]
MEKTIIYKGNNIGLTESRDNNSNLKDSLINLELNIFDFNTVTIENKLENLNKYIKELDKFNYLIFSTPLAVELFFSYLEKNKQIKFSKNINYCAIGKLTNRKLQEYNIESLICIKEFASNDLFEKMESVLNEDDQVLVLKSFSKFDNLEKNLKQVTNLTTNITEVNLYNEILKNKEEFDIYNIDTLIYTNPKAATNMLSIFDLKTLSSKKNIAIGTLTAKVLKEHNLDAFICKGHSRNLLDELIKYIK